MEIDEKSVIKSTDFINDLLYFSFSIQMIIMIPVRYRK